MSERVTPREHSAPPPWMKAHHASASQKSGAATAASAHAPDGSATRVSDRQSSGTHRRTAHLHAVEHQHPLTGRSLSCLTRLHSASKPLCARRRAFSGVRPVKMKRQVAAAFLQRRARVTVGHDLCTPWPKRPRQAQRIRLRELAFSQQLHAAQQRSQPQCWPPVAQSERCSSPTLVPHCLGSSHERAKPIGGTAGQPWPHSVSDVPPPSRAALPCHSSQRTRGRVLAAAAPVRVRDVASQRCKSTATYAQHAHLHLRCACSQYGGGLFWLLSRHRRHATLHDTRLLARDERQRVA